MNHAIHGAIRRDLTRVETGLRDIAGGRDRSAAVAATWANLYKQLDHHHTGEDVYLFPWLRVKGIEPDTVDTLEAEHVALMAAMTSAGTRVATACEPGDANRAAAAADSVANAATVIYTHVDHEEAFADDVLRPLMTDPSFKPIAKGLRKASFGDACRIFAWVFDDIEPASDASLRAAIPGPVIAIMTTLGRSYDREVASYWR